MLLRSVHCQSRKRGAIVTTQDSRLPWRVVNADGIWEVWTRQDNTPGSRNNYMIAGSIQTEAEAIKLAAAPEMYEALELSHAFVTRHHRKDDGANLLKRINAAIAKAEKGGAL